MSLEVTLEPEIAFRSQRAALNGGLLLALCFPVSETFGQTAGSMPTFGTATPKSSIARSLAAKQAGQSSVDRWVSACLLLLLFVFAAGCKQGRGNDQDAVRASTESDTVRKYIQAIQREDFKTLIDLDDEHKKAISKLKAENPQSLWSKLVTAYYDDQIKIISVDPRSVPAGLFGALDVGRNGTLVDPNKYWVFYGRQLFPLSSKWAIEGAPKTVRKEWYEGGPGTTVTAIYVNVDYPSSQDAPLLSETRRLKHTVVEFDLDPDSQLITTYSVNPVHRVRGVHRLPQGDVYEDITPNK